ncbi:MAG: carboxymuconolactone decarboxylase family protein [Rhodobacteraceae bacterium]|jgi:4-carboxymuconolactone decarboxylase|nr:carboxymuconolactone decarboxylase family protein [Paracoccaceae bacterium]
MTEDFTKIFAGWMAQGQEMAKAFAPNLDAKAFEKLFPAMPKEMLEAWFGKTFNPEGLDARTRFLLTIAGQVMLGAAGEAALRVTIKNALSAGATQREIAETIWQMSMFAAPTAVQKALEIAQGAFTETGDKA